MATRHIENSKIMTGDYLGAESRQCQCPVGVATGVIAPPLEFIIFIFSSFIKRAKLNTGSTVK